MSRYYEDDYRPRRKRKPGLGDWLFVIALTLIGIGVVVVSAPTAINLYLAYQNAAAVPTATQPALATAAVPQDTSVQQVGVSSGPAMIPTAQPQLQQTIIEQAPHVPRGMPTTAPIEQAPVTSQEAPQAAPTVEVHSIAVPTASNAVQASYSNRTQDRCSMPRANPQTCAQPIPPMATPVGNE